MPITRRRPAILAAVLAALLTSSVIAPSAVAADDPTLLLSYSFDSATGGVVPDDSGKGNTAQIAGAGATVSGGELRLPGGSASSGAGHLRLPTGVFDGRNTLTISTWLKNETASGNYAAMYFGSAASTPSQYWLLNPKNPDGRFKSVITNGQSATAPWGTEAGISATNTAASVQGPVTTSDYALYTTVITPTSLTGYLNGVKIGTVATTRTVSQFGTGLVSFIGRSSYNDPYFKGGVRDVKVWTTARTDTQIRDDFYDGADAVALDAALKADAATLGFGDGIITADLTLPSSGPNGSEVIWSSSDMARIAADGKVNRPISADAPVTLTATLTLRGRTLERSFDLTVAAAGTQRDLQLLADRFDLGITHVSTDLVLPTQVEGASVTWTSSRAATISTTGAVTRPATETGVELAAVFTRDGASVTRRLTVTVLAADTGFVGAYIGTGNTDRDDALRLAVSDNGTTFTAVNNNRGVLFPTLASRKLGNPELFRTPGGDFGLVAPLDSSSTQLYIYDSKDLVTYTNERLVTFSPTAATRVSVDYDNGIRAYRIGFIAAGTGALLEVTTKDFATFTAPASRTAPVPTSSASFPPGGIEGSSLAVTTAERAFVSERLGRVVSTGVTPFAPVRADQGTTPTLPTTATVEYSSGSTTTMGVQWDADDVAALNGAAPGTYSVDGTVQRQTYSNPLVERRADPDVTKGDDGWYYFTASYPTVSNSDAEGYDRIILRRAQTIEGLKTAQEVVIWDESVDPVLNRYIWAPELTKIGNSWYILFTAGRDPRNSFDIRPAMLKFTGSEFSGTATQNGANWTSLGQVKAQAGDVAFTAFSLDMTYVENKGRHYLAWAQYFGPDSTLFMAEIDPANPTQLKTNAMTLSSPGFAWEKPVGANWGIDEGPAFIKNDGKVIASFSAATVDDKYAVGLLWADEDADLLERASWTKVQYPVLSSADVPGQVGPGHNSFTVDQYGNPVIIYHARTPNDTVVPGEAADLGLNDPRRHARAATIHWDSAGLPIFNMTADEELRPDLARVKVQVVVNAVEPALQVTAVASARCVAGKVVVTITTTNKAAVPVGVTSTTTWGSKSTTAVAPSKNAAHAYTTRATAVPAGTATVSATGTVNGASATASATAPYASLNCG